MWLGEVISVVLQPEVLTTTFTVQVTSIRLPFIVTYSVHLIFNWKFVYLIVIYQEKENTIVSNLFLELEEDFRNLRQ